MSFLDGAGVVDFEEEAYCEVIYHAV